MDTDKVNQTPTITITDCETQTSVTREMTAEEILVHYPNWIETQDFASIEETPVADDLVEGEQP